MNDSSSAISFTRDMEFVHEKKDYNVAEFYERFNNDLPQIVIVTQGFCGTITEDTFDREQVLRIHVVSKQRRVIAKFQYKNNSRLISIPESYEERLCVVKQAGKHGKPKQLYTILRDYKLPLTVQFPKDHSITVGNQTVSTSNIPCMELVQTFDEVYLLSNFITDGSINQEVVLMPLYLSQLRLAVINGIKGQSEENWNAFRRKLDHVASSIEFDNEFGNLNIAEYDPRAVHTDTTYSYIEPTSYSSFISLVNKSAYKSVDTTVFNQEQQRREGLNVYEEIDNIARERQSARELYATLRLPQSQINSNSSPPLAPKPKRCINHDQITPPPLPKRTAIPDCLADTSTKLTTQSMYQNDVPRSRITPTINRTAKREAKSLPKDVSKKVRDVKNHADVAKLTIDEVVEYLKRLNLGQYADTFKTEQIDGRMLIQLDKDMLKEDFDMKGVEALRLVTFAKEGHMPN